MPSAAIVLTSQIAWPILAAVGINLQCFLTTAGVSAMRRKYKIAYPDSGMGRFASKLTDAQWTEFNNHQRVHMNYVENVTLVTTLQLLSGVFSPVASAVLGAVYMVGRGVYGYMYTRYGPEKRYYGAPFMYPAKLGMLGIVLYGCARLLGYLK
ncbi:hypothetical protein MP228_007407 [Amoeboaphelidium protococcarum]|nr:hypothetical protein MP228_007407 [Amoeboaphelidium protococcarum]